MGKSKSTNAPTTLLSAQPKTKSKRHRQQQRGPSVSAPRITPVEAYESEPRRPRQQSSEYLEHLETAAAHSGQHDPEASSKPEQRIAAVLLIQERQLKKEGL